MTNQNIWDLDNLESGPNVPLNLFIKEIVFLMTFKNYKSVFFLYVPFLFWGLKGLKMKIWFTKYIANI